MHVSADAFPNEAPEDAGEMHRVHARFRAQFIEGKPPAMLGVQLVPDAGKPERRLVRIFFRQASRMCSKFVEQAVHAEVVGTRGSMHLVKDIHREPQQFAPKFIVAR